MDPTYPRIPFDVRLYEARVQEDARSNQCFICAIVEGSLVAPLEHRAAVVGEFNEDEYLALQLRVHRVGRAVSAAVPTERVYVLSLGSMGGNAHVHWHVAPLPPGVPYAQQQYTALTAESGFLDIPDSDQAALAQQMGALMSEAAP